MGSGISSMGAFQSADRGESWERCALAAGRQWSVRGVCGHSIMERGTMGLSEFEREKSEREKNVRNCTSVFEEEECCGPRDEAAKRRSKSRGGHEKKLTKEETEKRHGSHSREVGCCVCRKPAGGQAGKLWVETVLFSGAF